jgi:hypothetical protein
MPTSTIKPAAITKLDDWSRQYQFDFTDSFLEFSGSSPPTVSGTPAVTADPGITATLVGASGAKVTVRIAGGRVGQSYDVAVVLALSTGDVLTLPAVVSVVAPGQGVPQQTLAKLPAWRRHYVFPFGKVFGEFNVTVPPTITGSPIFSCLPAGDGSTLSGTPNVSGGTVSVFVTGGNAAQSYEVRVTVSTSAGDTLSIPGVLAD